MNKNIGIGWQLHDRTGWGIYGINLALQLLSRSDYTPTLLFPPGQLPEHPLQKEALLPAIKNYHALIKVLTNNSGFRPISDNLTILHGLGNNFIHNETPVDSSSKAGVIFFENTLFDSQSRRRAAQFPLIITGSHWNEQVLKEQGFPSQIKTVIQGIDPTIFHPAPKAGLFKNRFVIFSGGKLEYRKGQDIVIAAFRIFQKRHPEALLLASWHNNWPESMAEIATRGHVSGYPKTAGNQQQAISNWLLENGLKEESFITLPTTPNIYMASIIREADVALFPNRGEGGTNLVAMETLACGVPTILAANTGQLDFANPDICYLLEKQTSAQATATMPGVEGWGESDLEEIVTALERIYCNPEKGRQCAQRAAIRMLDFTWEKQVTELLQILNDFFS